MTYRNAADVKEMLRRLKAGEIRPQHTERETPRQDAQPERAPKDELPYWADVED